MQLSRDELLSAYRTMATARHFEDSVFENFSDGKIPGFVHLSAGQEATAAGVYMSLDERDWIATTPSRSWPVHRPRAGFAGNHG